MDSVSLITNPLEMSLDEIIRLKRAVAESGAVSVAGSVKSYRSNRSTRSHHSQRSNRRSGGYTFQYRRMVPYQSRTGYRSYVQRRPQNFGYSWAQKRVRQATRYLNNYHGRVQRTYRPPVYSGRNYPPPPLMSLEIQAPGYRRVNAPRYQRAPTPRYERAQTPTYQRPRTPSYVSTRPVLGVFGPNSNRVERFQGVRDRVNQARSWRSGNMTDNDDTDSLTVSLVNDFYKAPVPNDLPPLVDSASRGSRKKIVYDDLPPLVNSAASSSSKTHAPDDLPPLVDLATNGFYEEDETELEELPALVDPAANGLPPLVDAAAGSSGVGALNRANVARHNAVMDGVTRRTLSPSGSIRTTISRASSRRRNRKRRALDHSHASTSQSGHWHQQVVWSRARNCVVPYRRHRLNPRIQRVIAMIQSKGAASRSAQLSDDDLYRPTAISTSTTLNNRFREVFQEQ